MGGISTVAFDADDTLWQNEQFFRLTQDRFGSLLADYADPEHLQERLLAAERRNIGHYGYGVKGFVLSMIETAIEITEDRVPAAIIRQLMEAGREMLEHPIHLMPHARATIEALAGRYRLLVITKGDLLDQERKVAQSGLGELFDGVEIVSHKPPESYRAIFQRQGTGPQDAMMIGNSLKSDVIPALAAGSWGVFVPHDFTWALEHDTAPTDHPRFRELRDLSGLAELLQKIG